MDHLTAFVMHLESRNLYVICDCTQSYDAVMKHHLLANNV